MYYTKLTFALVLIGMLNGIIAEDLLMERSADLDEDAYFQVNSFFFFTNISSDFLLFNY